MWVPLLPGVDPETLFVIYCGRGPVYLRGREPELLSTRCLGLIYDDQIHTQLSSAPHHDFLFTPTIDSIYV